MGRSIDNEQEKHDEEENLILSDHNHIEAEKFFSLSLDENFRGCGLPKPEEYQSVNPDLKKELIELLRMGKVHEFNFKRPQYPFRLRRLNLKHTDLRGINFSEIDLTNSNFLGSDLSFSQCLGTRFQDSNLFAAKLKGSNMFQASFFRANCGHANFNQTNLERAEFTQAKLPSATFRYSSCRDANFIATRCVSTSFEGTDLTRVDFVGAYFEDSVVIKCRLENVGISEEQLSRIILEEL